MKAAVITSPKARYRVTNRPEYDSRAAVPPAVNEIVAAISSL
jgi:hypothetical protein